jgi:RecA/RadA recombinase
MSKEFQVDTIGMLSELEKIVKVQAISLSAESRMSTGLLCLDLMTGGGITAGMYVVSGKEQSSKTTTLINALAASVKQDVGLRVLWDAENSSGSSTDYIENIFNSQGVKVAVEELFGERDKNGKYTKAPLVYYRDEGEMDTFFDWFAAFLRRLPDKRFENDRWWFVYEDDKKNRAKYGAHMDKRMSQVNNAIYIPAPDSSLQALVMCDSLPSLLPAALDEDESKAGMALQAREFSKHFPRVKGKLRAKRVAFLCVNQVREKPAAMFSDPTYEPGGAAPGFNSDVRIRNTPRALSGVPFNPKGKGQYESEDSVEFDGQDVYRYIHVKAIKNKLSKPNRESWLRLWVADANTNARGYCPVWDTFYCMYLTGQVSGKRSSMTLNVAGLGKAKKSLDWAEFKTLILLPKSDEAKKIFKKIGYAPVNLRQGMFKLMRKGKLEELYVESSKARASEKKKDEDAED